MAGFEVTPYGRFCTDPRGYELRVRVEGVGVAATQVVLVHSETKSKQVIAVNMSLNGVCSGFSLVDSKKVEAGLNQRSP